MATIRFAKVLKNLGHYVILYGSEENEAPCDEFVSCITKEEQQTLLGKTEYQHAAIDERWPLWALANPRMSREIGKRKQPRDAIMLIGGSSQKPVCDDHPDLLWVEYSIGYQGSFAPFRVFESIAWRHTTYGNQKIEDGRFFDDVIPCAFDKEEFEFNATKEPFALYVGRLVPRKGLVIACRAAEIAGMPLKVIGHGDPALVTNGAEYLGALPIDERNKVMSKASVVMCPTIYIEPFNCVAVEAQLCGTPVVSTDWGGFTETIEHGKTGYRCNYLGEFAQAIKDSQGLDHQYIRDRAVSKFAIENVQKQYAAYFKRIEMMWDKGWDTVNPLQ